MVLICQRTKVDTLFYPTFRCRGCPPLSHSRVRIRLTGSTPRSHLEHNQVMSAYLYGYHPVSHRMRHTIRGLDGTCDQGWIQTSVPTPLQRCFVSMLPGQPCSGGLNPHLRVNRHRCSRSGYRIISSGPVLIELRCSIIAPVS